jgi:hypothetical protein
MGYACRIMEIFTSKSGLLMRNLSLCSESSTDGTEGSTGAKRMNLGVFLQSSRPTEMELREFSIIQGTKFKLKEKMELGWTETVLGQLTKCKTKTLSSMIVCFGTLLKNSYGLIKNR